MVHGAMMYRSEQKFSEAFLRKLEPYCGVIQRIETGTTGRGVPDIYTVWHGGKEKWIELKNDPRQSIYNTPYYNMHWRPGQQPWHINYFRASGKRVITICSIKDGFVCYELEKRQVHGIVSRNDCVLCTELNDLIGIIQNSLIKHGNSGSDMI